MHPSYERSSCRVCESESLVAVMEMAGTPIGDEYVPAEKLDEPQDCYPLDLYFCEVCGQLQLKYSVDPEKIYSDYMYETAISLGLREHFKDYADEFNERVSPQQGGLVVDIGCNDATFLRTMKDKGFRVLGVEPAREISKKVASSGIEILNTFFSPATAVEIREKYGPAAVITANNVMANIDDLGAFARGVRALLADDGVFSYESGYMVDTLDGSVIDNVYHEHLCYFRVGPLVKYFDLHGMEYIDVLHAPTKGGSIRGTVQLKGGPRMRQASVDQWVKKEKEAGWDDVSTYRRFSAEMQELKGELLDLLEDLKAQGKKISGYGASVGVTTLLYYWDLSGYLDCLYDDNSIKHGLFSPGHHIPVRPSEKIYDDKPDYIICLAWRYLDPIKKRHEAFLEQSGHFIHPLPEVSIIGSPV